jgi:hypothetical protein
MVRPLPPKFDKGNSTRQNRSDLSSALEKQEKSTFFPRNIVELDHWMAFRINQHKLLKKNDFPFSEDIHRIFLPLPLQLSTAYNQSYDSGGIGAPGAALAGLAPKVESAITSMVSNIQNGGNKRDAVQGATKNAFDSVGGIGGLLKEGGAALAAGVIKSAAESLPGGKGALGGIGISVNPYLLRQHQFSWKLVAKDYTESLAIYKIITLFKYYSAPDVSSKLGALSKHLLKYPQQFDVDFHHDDYLYNIGPSVLTAMEVNYHPDGILYHAQDPDSVEDDDTPSRPLKLPVAVQLSLTLQEVSIVTKSEINDYDR